MGFLEKFLESIETDQLFAQKDRLLIAVSGGVDSVVLCHLCKQAGFDFGIAHCNFQLRGEDSLRDESFVLQLGLVYDVPVYTIRFDTEKFSEEKKVSIQEAARELRYSWFEKIRIAHHFDYVLTAHHADDSIETVVMNFFRGSGIAGLTGIKPINGKIRRPLLFALRTEIENYLKDHRLLFVQDESNLHNKYTRNNFRNTILPLITDLYPEAYQNILNNIERMKEVETLYQSEISKLKRQLLLEKGEELMIPILLLQKQQAKATVLFEIVKPFSFRATQLPELLRLLDSDSGKYMVSATHRILKDRKHLIIASLKKTQALSIIIESEGSYSFANGILAVSTCGFKTILQNENIACVDASKVQYPLILRPWRMGDYFYPLGMQKKKKLSKFFIDKKLSIVDKEKIWVVEMNKKIIWVVGQRIDDRFKVADVTSSVLKLEWNH